MSAEGMSMGSLSVVRSMLALLGALLLASVTACSGPTDTDAAAPKRYIETAQVSQAAKDRYGEQAQAAYRELATFSLEEWLKPAVLDPQTPPSTASNCRRGSPRGWSGPRWCAGTSRSLPRSPAIGRPSRTSASCAWTPWMPRRCRCPREATRWSASRSRPARCRSARSAPVAWRPSSCPSPRTPTSACATDAAPTTSRCTSPWSSTLARVVPMYWSVSPGRRPRPGPLPARYPPRQKPSYRPPPCT